MYSIIVKRPECWDEKNEVFIPESKPKEIVMEHSLVSVSKWEAKWHKSFFNEHQGLTLEEELDYYRCMTITQNVDDDLYKYITPQQRNEIRQYIDDPMTATTFRDDKSRPLNKNTIITSEIIYYWMISNNIPVEFQKWHLNRLITLIRVCAEKNAPSKKRSREEMLAERRALNASRRARHHSKG